MARADSSSEANRTRTETAGVASGRDRDALQPQYRNKNKHGTADWADKPVHCVTAASLEVLSVFSSEEDCGSLKFKLTAVKSWWRPVVINRTICGCFLQRLHSQPSHFPAIVRKDLLGAVASQTNIANHISGAVVTRSLSEWKQAPHSLHGLCKSPWPPGGGGNMPTIKTPPIATILISAPPLWTKSTDAHF